MRTIPMLMRRYKRRSKFAPLFGRIYVLNNILFVSARNILFFLFLRVTVLPGVILSLWHSGTLALWHYLFKGARS